MRKLVQAYGLEPGNHSDNAKLLLKQDHVDYHREYWPEARKNLEKMAGRQRTKQKINYLELNCSRKRRLRKEIRRRSYGITRAS